MSRIRTVKPEWLDDERLVCASSDARVLSIALITLADDHGRGRASVVLLGGRVFPNHANPREDAAKAREELVSARYVLVYEVDGQEYYQIRNWAKHQRVDRPSASQLPPPPSGSEHKPLCCEPPANIREDAPRPRVVLATDLDLDRGPGEDREGSTRAVAPPPAASPAQSTQEPPPGSIGAILRAAPAPRPDPEQDAPCQLPEFTEATIRAVRKQVHDLYTNNVGYSHDLNGQHIQRLTQTLRGVAQARGEALPVVVERTVSGFLADPYWQGKRWPLNGLVRQAAQYADPAKPEDIKVVDRAQVESKIGSLRGKINEAQTDRALAASMNPGEVAKIDERIAGMRREMKRLEGAA